MSLFFSRILKHWARRANSCFFSSVPRSPYLKTPEGTIVQPSIARLDDEDRPQHVTSRGCVHAMGFISKSRIIA
ncbi:unnamed protein product [Arabis nemorensis]|uniref:Uncharacterized protein n=1 Tax=Arabis nemorensis TaxID=586526 RepID=A0A565BE94_9BRAS|nr:unnamed protein product [Arabis nemorensis]